MGMDARTIDRPTHVAHQTISALTHVMTRAGREELVPYAGASWRDPVAWQMCLEYLSEPTADEAVLKSRALRVACGVDVSPENIRALLGR